MTVDIMAYNDASGAGAQLPQPVKGIVSKLDIARGRIV
jgi:hypothetical protein